MGPMERPGAASPQRQPKQPPGAARGSKHPADTWGWKILIRSPQGCSITRNAADTHTAAWIEPGPWSLMMPSPHPLLPELSQWEGARDDGYPSPGARKAPGCNGVHRCTLQSCSRATKHLVLPLQGLNPCGDCPQLTQTPWGEPARLQDLTKDSRLFPLSQHRIQSGSCGLGTSHLVPRPRGGPSTAGSCSLALSSSAALGAACLTLGTAPAPAA